MPMRWKAKENYIVAEMALNNDHLNAAAARFYYAAYQIMMSFIELNSDSVPRQNLLDAVEREKADINKWSHGAIIGVYDVVSKYKMKEYKGNTYLKQLYQLRLTADYKPADVKIDELYLALTKLSDFFDDSGVRK